MVLFMAILLTYITYVVVKLNLTKKGVREFVIKQKTNMNCIKVDVSFHNGVSSHG